MLLVGRDWLGLLMTRELEYFLGLHCHVNAREADYDGHLARTLRGLRQPQRAAAFKQQLAAAITRGTFSQFDYERATGEDFDTDDELIAELRTLWNGLYPGEEPHAAE